jgi:hypothetical protein
MARRAPRSLRHEYELFVEEEIENYKESVPRSALLAIGDEAVAQLADQPQLALTELLLCEEVDRIIRGRLRLPGYDSWRRKRVKQLEELRRPERWGLSADDVLVRSVRPVAEAHVLVAGTRSDAPALYLAANGCAVTAVFEEADAVQRVLDAAAAAGLAPRVRGVVQGLSEWRPDAPLDAVICTAASLTGLSNADRGRVIDALQAATLLGGVHYLEATELSSSSVASLQKHYRGWQVTVEPGSSAGRTFVAKKLVA